MKRQIGNGLLAIKLRLLSIKPKRKPGKLSGHCKLLFVDNTLWALCTLRVIYLLPVRMWASADLPGRD
jgi:hypothetical protein